MKRDCVTLEELGKAMAAVMDEVAYQNNLERRTDDEAKDVPGFLTLLRVYLRKAEDVWANNPGPERALHEMRKLAAIAVRGMAYCGVRGRNDGVSA